jgi:hypothetical protein
MNEIDIDNYRSEQNQTKRDETSDKQEQAANYLEHGDDVNVVAQEKGLREVSKQPRLWRWHGNEVQKDIRSEDDENKSEQDPGNNCGDFHLSMLR